MLENHKPKTGCNFFVFYLYFCHFLFDNSTICTTCLTRFMKQIKVKINFYNQCSIKHHTIGSFQINFFKTNLCQRCLFVGTKLQFLITSALLMDIIKRLIEYTIIAYCNSFMVWNYE